MKSKLLLIAGMCALLSSCGGTLSVSPFGEFSYTTPRYIPPVQVKVEEPRPILGDK